MSMEIEPIADVREDFATFAPKTNQSGEERFQELQRELRRMAYHVNTGEELERVRRLRETVLAECHYPETLEELENGTGEVRRVEVVTGHYIVTGNIMEVALIACEMVKQQMENERLNRLLPSDEQ